MTKKHFSKERIAEIVQSHSLYCEYAPSDWRSGLLIGNGDVGAIAYAPGSREWVVNKTDIFDGRTYNANLTPHDKMMKIIKERDDDYSFFINELEKRTDNISEFRSITPFVLRLCAGNGELGWSAPAFPKMSDLLSIYDGSIETTFDAHFIHSTVKSIVPRGREAIAIRLTGCAVADWDNKLEIYRPYNESLEYPEFSVFGEYGMAFKQTLPDNIGSYAVAVVIKPREHDESRLTHALPHDFKFSQRKPYVTGMKNGRLAAYRMCGGDIDIFIGIASEYRHSDPLSAAIKEAEDAANLGYEALDRENAEWWHNFWQKSMVDFGKHKDIEHYWIYSLYALATSYEKHPMPALTGMLYGPLNATTPGVSAHSYTADQNIEIPMIPTSILNHADMVSVFADTFYANSENLRAHTRELFGSTGGNGIFIPLVSNQNCKELTSGCYRYTMCGSAYCGLVLARTWEYSGDDELMREKLFPLLKEFITFYTENLMNLGEDGLYHLDPTIPPEIFRFTRDDLSTISMLHTCMRAALKWCDQEGINDEQTEKWRDILSKYPKLCTRKDGSYIGGPDIPDDYFSFGTHQLYPFFPAEEYLEESDRETARKTIDYIDREAIERCFSGENNWHFIHGWSWYLYYGTLMHLGECALVWNKLFDFIRFFGKDNGLFTHNSIIEISSEKSELNHNTYKRKDQVTCDMTTPPDWYGVKCSSPNVHSKELTAPVIEGSAIFLLLSTESMIHSYDSTIRLFRAVPEDFEGGFYKLMAKGGFEVSAYRKEKQLSELTVTSKKDATLTILYHDGMIIPENAEQHTTAEGTVITIPMKKGETISLA